MTGTEERTKATADATLKRNTTDFESKKIPINEVQELNWFQRFLYGIARFFRNLFNKIFLPHNIIEVSEDKLRAAQTSYRTGEDTEQESEEQDKNRPMQDTLEDKPLKPPVSKEQNQEVQNQEEHEQKASDELLNKEVTVNTEKEEAITENDDVTIENDDMDMADTVKSQTDEDVSQSVKHDDTFVDSETTVEIRRNLLQELKNINNQFADIDIIDGKLSILVDLNKEQNQFGILSFGENNKSAFHIFEKEYEVTDVVSLRTMYKDDKTLFDNNATPPIDMIKRLKFFLVSSKENIDTLKEAHKEKQCEVHLNKSAEKSNAQRLSEIVEDMKSMLDNEYSVKPILGKMVFIFSKDIDESTSSVSYTVNLNDFVNVTVDKELQYYDTNSIIDSENISMNSVPGEIQNCISCILENKDIFSEFIVRDNNHEKDSEIKTEKIEETEKLYSENDDVYIGKNKDDEKERTCQRYAERSKKTFEQNFDEMDFDGIYVKVIGSDEPPDKDDDFDR